MSSKLPLGNYLKVKFRLLSYSIFWTHLMVFFFSNKWADSSITRMIKVRIYKNGHLWDHDLRLHFTDEYRWVCHSELGNSHLHRKHDKRSINMNWNSRFLMHAWKALENTQHNVNICQMLNAEMTVILYILVHMNTHTHTHTYTRARTHTHTEGKKEIFLSCSYWQAQ